MVLIYCTQPLFNNVLARYYNDAHLSHTITIQYYSDEITISAFLLHILYFLSSQHCLKETKVPVLE